MSGLCNVCGEPGEFYPSCPTRCKKCYAKSKKKYRSTEKYLKSKRSYDKDWRSQNKEHVAEMDAASYRRKKQPARSAVLIIRRRRNSCKHLGIPFSITAEDISPVPENCPILGIPLFMGEGVVGPNSPTIDRIDPSGGYVPGNVMVVSHRANTIKHNASLEELEKVVEFMRGRG